MQKIMILLLLSCLSSVVPCWGQLCKQEQLKDEKKLLLLEGYVVQMSLANHITKDTGVVLLNRSVDSLGRDNWYLATAQYADIYKSAPTPPQSYYKIYDKIVLIWDDNRFQPMDSLQKQPIIACLNNLVGNKLIHSKPGKWKWRAKYDAGGRPVLDENKQPVKERVFSRSSVAPELGSIIYIFNKDGSIQKVQPL